MTTDTIMMEGTKLDTDFLDSAARMLQDASHKGRTVLTVLYLCVLSMCFLVPMFFYARMNCDDRRNRRLREMEMATMTQALSESQTAAQREETRATRRKYREERRARILQLFGPVRMVSRGLIYYFVFGHACLRWESSHPVVFLLEISFRF
jgi:hypothetical protein